MAQVWKCLNCGYVTWHPQEAGDHERQYYGTLIHQTHDDDGLPLHYMDDIGE